MSYPSLRTFISEEFAPDIKPEDLSTDLDLIETGIVDSLGVLKLIAFLEGEFDLNITPDELDADLYRSIALIETMITEKQMKVAV